MLYILVFTCTFLVNISANKINQFVVDYFSFKQIPSVVGFSCNLLKEDLELVGDFNERGIAIALHKITNETSIKLLARNKYEKLGIFLDSECYDPAYVDIIFSEASDNFMFFELHYWLILGLDVKNTLELIDDQSFGVSTDFVVSIRSHESSYDLYDVYNICKEHSGPLNVTFLGTWDNTNGITISLTQEKYPRRANLHRLVFKAIFLKLKNRPENWSISKYLSRYHYPVDEGQNRYGFSILTHFADLHNISMEYYEAPNPHPNDTFGAHARAIANNSIDISGNPLLISQARMYFMKFTHQDWPFRTCFIFRNPQPNNIKTHEIFRPFATSVWYLILTFVTANIIILGVLLKFENQRDKMMRFSNSFIINIGSICQQCSIEKVTRFSTRIALLFIMLFASVLYDYYSSSVVSARLNEPIVKINDSLFQFGKLNLGMASDYMAYFRLLLSYGDWETKFFHKNIWLKIPESKWYMDPEEGMRLVKKGGFAYHAHPEAGYPFIESLFTNNEVCELMEVHLSRPKFTTFAVRYNSTIVQVARVGLTKISEVGLRHRAISRWQNRKPICRKEILSAASINMYEFAPHLILLAIGMMLSIIVYICEVMIYNCKYFLNKRHLIKKYLLMKKL